MFGFFGPKKAEVLSHWYTPVPGFSASTNDFYAEVEKELREEKVPGLEMARVEFAEGGMLSEKRTYLRLTRERLVFDICAAPFGTSYFYSCRFAEIPSVVRLWELVALGLGLFFFALLSFDVFVRIFGLMAPFLWPVAFIAFIVLGIYTMRNSVAMGLANLDATLIKTPVLGAVYEAWFRKETYYRQDTRLMYVTVVEGIVKKLVEEETAAKGVRLLKQHEYSPILRELYKERPLAANETKGAPASRM